MDGEPTRPRILLTLPDTPWPVDGGKRLRGNAVLRGLAQVGDVDLAVLFSAAPPGPSPVPDGIRVRRWIRLSPRPRARVPGAVAALTRLRPVHVGAQDWGVVRRRLAAWQSGPYDLVWFGGLDHASALRDLLVAPRTVVDCDDVQTEKWRAYLATGSASHLQRLQRRLELPLWRRIQADAIRRADAVVVCSDLDADRLATPKAVTVPNTYPEPVLRTAGAPDVPPPDPGDVRLVMVASWTTAQNVDAARYGALEVLPEVRRHLPGARLRLAGRGADDLADLADVDGVDVVGPVDDVAPELSRAAAVVVPMRFGGGARLKILEAFAHGVPVVSTTLGSQGTPVADGVHLLVRDEPRSFADAVVQVVRDEALRRRLTTAGRQLYDLEFRPGNADAAIGALVARLLG